METPLSGAWIGGVCLMTVGFLLLLFWAEEKGENNIKKEAKEKGYMVFVIDQDTGKTKLDWK